MARKRLIQLCLLGVTALFFVVVGCGGSSVADLNGVWVNPDTKEKVEIKFNGKTKIIVVQNKEIAVSVKETEQDNYTLHSLNNTDEKWELRKIFKDTGSDFKLAFVHNGKKEMLNKIKG
jgi:hypothetical protein